jgi:hypothetical protein
MKNFLFAPYGESFSNQTSKNLKSKRKDFDRQVFACKTLSFADSSSVANDVQRRIKKVTPLLLLDVLKRGVHSGLGNPSLTRNSRLMMNQR